MKPDKSFDEWWDEVCATLPIHRRGQMSDAYMAGYLAGAESAADLCDRRGDHYEKMSIELGEGDHQASRRCEYRRQAAHAIAIEIRAMLAKLEDPAGATT